MESFHGLWFECEGCDTETSSEQRNCEEECSHFLKPLGAYCFESLQNFRKGGLANADNEIRVLRASHTKYLRTGLGRLPRGFVSLDASRPWICYWITHALTLLNKPLPNPDNIIDTLATMQASTGGFGGGVGQLSHCAPTYAGVLCLCTVGTSRALSSINVPAMYSFFLSMKHVSGGFRMHKDGEVDCRGTYTVIAVARILNILTPELTAGVAEYLLRCQTYEGGFGGEPGNEAHGGYNFCALAALTILNKASECDIRAQERWLLGRQTKLEGGFMGRTNKLVDSCYSFWQGAAMTLIEVLRRGGGDTYDLSQFVQLRDGKGKGVLDNSSSSSGSSSSDSISDSDCDDVLSAEDKAAFALAEATASIDIDVCVEVSEVERVQVVDDDTGLLPFNQKALQRYILHCAQQMDDGGLRDKPGKSRDFYHSCYALSGLSIAQNCHIIGRLPHEEVASLLPPQPQVYGDLDNLLVPTSAVFNISLARLEYALEFFQHLTPELKDKHSILLARAAQPLEV